MKKIIKKAEDHTGKMMNKDRRRSSDVYSLGSLKMHFPSFFQKQFRMVSIEDLYTRYWIRHQRLLLFKLLLILIVYSLFNLVLYHAVGDITVRTTSFTWKKII